MKNDVAPESVEPKAHNQQDDIGIAGASNADVKKADTTTKKDTREPYVKPTFRMEKVFCTSALSCGKMSGGGGACNLHTKVS
jgi:hypothetical protein